MPLILRRMPQPGESPTVREERLARVAACQSAIGGLTLSEEEIQGHTPEWVAMHQEVMGHLTQEYRNRVQLLDDGSGTASSIEIQREAPEVVRQRKLRYLLEIELRLRCIHQERDALYAERQAHRINDESLRRLVSELDMQEISLRKRLVVARRAAASAMAAPEGGTP